MVAEGAESNDAPISRDRRLASGLADRQPLQRAGIQVANINPAWTCRPWAQISCLRAEYDPTPTGGDIGLIVVPISGGATSGGGWADSWSCSGWGCSSPSSRSARSGGATAMPPFAQGGIALRQLDPRQGSRRRLPRHRLRDQGLPARRLSRSALFHQHAPLFAGIFPDLWSRNRL